MNKYTAHLPLYRQSALLERDCGIEITRATMCGWVMQVGEMLGPVVGAMRMAGVEQTEAWLHQSQRRVEEEKLRDPDDVYISVRQREAERLRQRLSPRIQFLDESLPAKAPAAKNRKAG